MTNVLIDATVVISFLHSRAKDQQKKASKLFEKGVENRHKLLLHQHVIAETVYVLRNVYDLNVDDVSEIMQELLSLPGVERVDMLNDSRWMDLWPEELEDFGDAVIATVGLEENCETATFDQELAKRLRQIGVSVYEW